MSVISLRDGHKVHGECHALHGIDLEIAGGEFLSLLGPSGCGKTTLLRAIAGVETFDRGHLSIDGQDMTRKPADEHPTCMVVQSDALLSHLSIRENVEYGLRRSALNKADQARAVCDALEMVGLDGDPSRLVQALSGAQKQRVALAQALCRKPKVLLLDEPVSALDQRIRREMRTDLRRLQRQVGITFILATRDKTEALVLSDRIAVMFDGAIAQVDTPQALYRTPVSREVGDFTGRMTVMPGTLTPEEGRLMADVPGLGRFPATADLLPEGQGAGPIAFGLRPESLSVVLPGDLPPGNLVDGVVQDRFSLGPMTLYEVLLDGAGTPVTISSRNLGSRPVLDPGTRVRVAWEPAALIAFAPTACP